MVYILSTTSGNTTGLTFEAARNDWNGSAPDGSVSFNRWTAAANRRSAQDTFFNDTETKADGTTTTVRRPSWQAVPEYYSEQGRNQFDYISAALKDLQTTGFDRMSQIYSKAMGEIG